MIRSGFKRAQLNRAPRGLPAPIPLEHRRGTLAPCDGGARPAPKPPEPVRDKEYRRLVAALPCFSCKANGQSQAAHPNTGKAKGKKTCDLLVFPLCTIGSMDCHGRFDTYRLVPRTEMPEFERRAYQWTVRQLLARGEWPKHLPIPDIRDFQ